VKPVLDKWSQPRRNVAFGPLAFGIFFVVFLILGFSINDIFLPLLLGVPAGIAGAWALVGWPIIARKDGKPLVTPEHKPFLFFPLALAFAIIAYPTLGVLLTKVAVPPKYLVVTSLVLAIVGACVAAFFLVGFPHLLRFARQQYAALPPERRPFLFFPLFAVIFLVSYVGLGVGTTAALSNFQDKVVLLLNIQVLLLLPFTLLVSAFLAYLLVGFPKPQKPIGDSLPKVTGKHRPRAFLITFALAGLPLTLAVGVLLSYVAKTDATSTAFLPDALVLPLAFALGYSLSLGAAAIVWGTPARWRRYEDYTPGLTPRARLGAAGAAGLATALAVVIAFGLAGIDIFWGLVVGMMLGASIGLLVSGAYRRVTARRGQGTLMPDLPDRVKSAVLLTTWFVLALVVFSVLTYALPAIVGWNAGIAIVLGLAIALLLVEQSWLHDAMARSKAERDRKKAWNQHRKEALAKAKGGSEDAPPDLPR